MRGAWLERLWDSVADRGRDLLNLPAGEPGADDLERLCRRLLSGDGEASGTALAREVRRTVESLDDDQRLSFLELLADGFGPDPAAVLVATERYREDPHDPGALLALNAAVEPPRQELLRRINRAPRATATLVALRGRLLDLLPDNPGLRVVDADFRHLFQSWFNRGFLELRRIDWNSPAAVLEKLIHYEAVHAIRDWSDLRRRLAADRRCFAFFHPALPDDPLIFVEVALTRGLADGAAPLLDLEAPVLDSREADTAVFFSINNCQAGLRGISFGNFLIKQVVGELSREFDRISTWATLSPVPRLAAALGRVDAPDAPLPRSTVNALLAEYADTLLAEGPGSDACDALLQLLRDAPGQRDVLEAPLRRLALAYLARCRRNGRALDPVAAFHLANGARLERVLPFADDSERRRKDSFGLMVNYLYEPDEVEQNHERYMASGEVAVSRALSRELRRVDRTMGDI